MQVCKLQLETGEVRLGIVADDHVQLLIGLNSLSDLLYSDDPAAVASGLIDENAQKLPLEDVTLLAPIDERSREARERESEGAARFYDLVYSASRPELFFKANPHRVVGPGGQVHIRRDSKWSVPEPELALVISPQLRIVGYTIGNDLSARDIEGENPLYLPQAKVYDNCCALGPVVTLADSMPPPDNVTIHLAIERQGAKVFAGVTRLSAMARSFEDLVNWLGRETGFLNGVILLTGTGIVPPDDFSLAVGDHITIDITGIGRLTNWVAHRD